MQFEFEIFARSNSTHDCLLQDRLNIFIKCKIETLNLFLFNQFPRIAVDQRQNLKWAWHVQQDQSDFAMEEDQP
jgi:hypothetical protein